MQRLPSSPALLHGQVCLDSLVHHHWLPSVLTEYKRFCKRMIEQEIVLGERKKYCVVN